MDREYIAGLKRWQNRWIHVSRGVGNLHGVRFNCRPEVTRIHLLPDTPKTRASEGLNKSQDRAITVAAQNHDTEPRQ